MNAINPSIIRPGLLVSLKTSVVGGVRYEKRELEPEHRIDGDPSATLARWETARMIADAAEHESATKTRGRIRTIIGAACCPSSFGLLCPIGNEEKLQAAIAEARGLADTFNREARFSRVECYVITGRVSDSDLEAARAIGAEVRGLVEAMQDGIKAADPEAIREAANRARAVAGMLSDDTQRKVGAAIAEARNAAREIVRRVEKAGERAADVVATLTLERLEAARFAVLDLGDGAAPELGEISAPAAPSLDLFALDAIAPGPDLEPAAPPAALAALELDALPDLGDPMAMLRLAAPASAPAPTWEL